MIKIFATFIKKEALHIIRDTRTLVILFGMPIVLVLIFGYTVSNEFKGASMAIYDQSKDELSKALTDHLVSSGHFELISMATDMQSLEAAFEAGKVKIGLVIPPQFEHQFFKEKKANIQLITDGAEPNYATTLTSYASQMIKAFQQQHAPPQARMPYQIRLETRMLYNPTLAGAYTFVPGVVALILMLICAMMTSLTIAKEKETGTMDLLLVSPLPPLLIIMGKVTPYMLLSFISALLVFAMGYYIFDVPIIGSLPLLLGISLLYLLVALALGVLISTKAANQQAAMMTSLFSLLMPTMLLSGFLFPIESMPIILQYVTKFIPAKYFIIIEKAIMLKGATLAEVWQPLVVLSIMFLVLVGISLRSFKVRYE